MLLMIEKGIREEICHSIDQDAKANNKYIKDYDKNNKLSDLHYWDVNNWYGWVMSQKLEWIKDTFQSNEDFIKTIMEKVIKDSWSWCSISRKITWTS